MIDELTSLPLYTQYVGDYVQKKMNIDYKMWARPTIPWKLECEATKPRDKIFDTMINARENSGGASSWNFWIYVVTGALLIALPLIGGCFMVMMGRTFEKYAFMAMVGFAEALVLIGGFGIRFLSKNGVKSIDDKWKGLNELAAINGCSDEFTNLPIDTI